VHSIQAEVDPQREIGDLIPLVPIQQLTVPSHQTLVGIVWEAEGDLLEHRRKAEIDRLACPGLPRRPFDVAVHARRRLRCQRNR
jgi:hypothetical protein